VNQPAAPELPDSSTMSRFIVRREWIRPDCFVKSDAFVPYPHRELSVTLHANLDEGAIWNRGSDVISLLMRKTGNEKTLIGRADLQAGDVRETSHRELDVVSRPLQHNPEHAAIIGWPPDKAAQKSVAQRVAAASVFVPRPA